MKLEHGELSGQVAGGEGGMGRAQHSQGLQAMLSAMGSIQHFINQEDNRICFTF